MIPPTPSTKPRSTKFCMVLNPPDLIAAVRHRITQAALGAMGGETIEMGLSEQRPRCILLVEDSIATRTQEKRILESAGYEVVTAVDGADGFNKLQSRAFDAVISDIQMPNLDGLQLTARIRQHREYSELPVVLVTTLASDADRQQGPKPEPVPTLPRAALIRKCFSKPWND